MGEPIKVWRFEDAPSDLQDLSTSGGDEDWLALVPASFGEVPYWISHSQWFGCCDIQEHKMPDGSWVCIGAHA